MKAITDRAALILMTCAALAWTTACQTNTETKSGSVNSSTTNTPAQTNTLAQAATNVNQPESSTPASSASSETGSLATPTETYKTGYAARQKKDIAALKRVLSKEALEFLTEVGKDEQKTLDDQLRTLAERPQATTDESRNEKISGNRATLEYRDPAGKWVLMGFLKEGSDWKIDLPKGP